MEEVREAFSKIKEDMSYLKDEILNIKAELSKTQTQMLEMGKLFIQINEKNTSKLQNFDSSKEQSLYSKTLTHPTDVSTLRHINQTDSSDSSTLRHTVSPLGVNNTGISTGNQGASTDRQTDTSTDRQTQNSVENPQNPLDNALNALDSLDNIKKEIRLQFKRLTEQEILIFSAIYQLDEQTGYTDYKTLSNKLKLSESSIRDYVGRLIKKQIPIIKQKFNNKNIQLKISPDLKRIATLPTILSLREM